jgi:hypothetical protein
MRRLSDPRPGVPGNRALRISGGGLPATRLPHLGQMYREAGFLRVANSVARCLSILDVGGMMDIPDARPAAHHFAALLLWIPGNRPCSPSPCRWASRN